MILQVDPMARSSSVDWAEHDTLLSVSECGELAFWEGLSAAEWRCTGKVKTGRTGFRMARCSSAKKSALSELYLTAALIRLSYMCMISVVKCPEGEELTIWDSKESEFASGLEYCYLSRYVLSYGGGKWINKDLYSTEEPINDLDWTSTPDNQSILAVGRAHEIELLCQQRKTYFDDGPGWSICWKIQIGRFVDNSMSYLALTRLINALLCSFVPYPISDSIWLAHGSFLVGAGHQMFLHCQPRLSHGKHAESLFEYVARQNGPLEDYHPQMLLQCLLWGNYLFPDFLVVPNQNDTEKVELVKETILNLARNFEETQEMRLNSDRKSIPVEEYWRKDRPTKSVCVAICFSCIEHLPKRTPD
jgi:hypothetical protein